jgi:hypothetical protein
MDLFCHHFDYLASWTTACTYYSNGAAFRNTNGYLRKANEHDIPWEQKLNKTVWRGITMTGIVESGRFPYNFAMDTNVKNIITEVIINPFYDVY